MTTAAPAGGGSSAPIELQIGGMTCASCAARIEKRLNRMPGVSASVNYATEKAVVRIDDVPANANESRADAAALIAEVERTGYTATVPAPPVPAAPPTQNDDGCAIL